MRMINRSVALLQARQPYVDWANRSREGGPALTVEDFAGRGSSFLIPDFEDETEAQAFVERHASVMFEHELGMWNDDPSVWPPIRDAATFREWFDVEVHDVVMDLGDDDLYAEEV
jgi:hypothetical protein